MVSFTNEKKKKKKEEEEETNLSKDKVKDLAGLSEFAFVVKRSSVKQKELHLAFLHFRSGHEVQVVRNLNRRRRGRR